MSTAEQTYEEIRSQMLFAKTREEAFAPLEKFLEATGRAGTTTKYMYMCHLKNGEYQYKHYDTRNYLVLDINGKVIRGKYESADYWKED